MQKKRILKGVGLIFCGALALYLFVQHLIGYNDWFLLAHPEVKLYVGVNVVSKFADFSFFTYITIILFGLWCVLFGFSLFFKKSKFENFLRKSSILSFVFTNYFLTVILYTIFEFTVTGGTFGLYSKTAPLAWHNLGTNIIVHYVLFSVACVIFAKVKTQKSNLNIGRGVVCCFLLTYYVIVKLTGEFVYRIRWFPYSIFDASYFGQTIGVSSYSTSVVLLVLVYVLILAFYLYFFTLFAKLKEKQQEKILRKSVLKYK